MANAYTERLQSLKDQSASQNLRQLQNLSSIPTRKPGTQTPPNGSVTPPGNIAPDQPEVDETYKDSTFYQNFDYHRQNDPHFDSFTGELTKLATGLRHQVQNGYMPQAIAEQNIRQFIYDTMHRRGVADPHIQRQNAAKQVEQNFHQAVQMAVANPTPDSAMSQALAQQQQQQAPVEPVDQGGTNG